VRGSLLASFVYGVGPSQGTQLAFFDPGGQAWELATGGLHLWHRPLLAFPFFVLDDKRGAVARLLLLALSFDLAAAP
jgi:hypothetical protein